MNKHLLLGGLAAAAVFPAMAIAQSQSPASAAPGYGADVAYTSSDPWTGAPQGVRAREDWLEHKIRTAMSDGTMDNYQGRDMLKEIRDIRRMDAADRAAGGLNDQQKAEIEARLDGVHVKAVEAIKHDQVRSY